MGMAEIKRSARTAIHNRAAEPCFYSDRATPLTPSAEQSAEGLSLSVRFKSKLKAASAEADGVSILENIESLIFNRDQLAALALELEHGGIVQLPGYELSFELDQEMDADGPLNVYWTVVRAQ
jgi:hypothetical protein